VSSVSIWRQRIDTFLALGKRGVALSEPLFERRYATVVVRQLVAHPGRFGIAPGQLARDPDLFVARHVQRPLHRRDRFFDVALLAQQRDAVSSAAAREQLEPLVSAASIRICAANDCCKEVA
jgi:hypothetical protein